MTVNVGAPFTYDLVFGDVTFDESININLDGGGEINSALGTRVKAPELTLQANGGDVGLTRDFNTAVRTLRPGAVPTFDRVIVRNTLDIGEDLKVEGEWFVATAFFIITSGDLEIGRIVKNTTAQGGITAIVENGNELTVRPNAIISAQEASILLQGGTVALPGTVVLGSGVELEAFTTTDIGALGNVVVLCGAATNPTPYFDNDIDNVRLVQPETSFVGGPNRLTANEPDNRIDVRNRNVTLYGPLEESITLAGEVFIRAEGNV